MARRNFGSQITALVVDDNVLNRRIHEKLLESAGVRNHEGVENGKVAVDIHCHGRRFDLILMDMDMPIMNGIQVILTLITSHATLPLLLLLFLFFLNFYSYIFF